MSKKKEISDNKLRPFKCQEKSEVAHLNGIDYFDPFLERNLEHPTTNGETLTHLLKASLGTGILAMPLAFQCSGLITGIFATLCVSFVCTYCSYLLVKCAHTLYRRTKVSSMSYADVAEVAFANGPQWSRKFSLITRQSVLWLLFVTYFGTCSVYTVIIASNFEQLFTHHMGYELNLRYFISILLIPLILLSYVPNLKYLAPVSMVANLLMATGLGITFYYTLCDVPNISERPAVGTLETFPTYFCLTVFAMEAIGVVMPLENNMKTPRSFLGVFGVLNIGMGCVTIVYILLGFFGYLKYGEATKSSITLNLPTEDLAAQVAKICISLAVFCTYGLQFFVCLEIMWNKIEETFERTTILHNYVLRTVLVIASVLIAVAVPTIGPFIGLIGAFCFSLLGIIVPLIIEFATYWDEVTVWMTIRNLVLIVVGVLALVFGTANSIADIIAAYDPAQAVECVINSTLPQPIAE
ncbi:proton-coupled amino acid transporter-like protein pathetic [Acyrthosiphon pisum]|uniref:Amino acid transporter transmembrane domain-containing protein n=1 Tax=Acyrthosiphon pisum TaxID=7029 RepID=A0A8R2H609_ACYPI|nr:proton-coupled amino acid transporter-like protein pathetic [Acyrthosiphon pisum]XP_016660357.1 proton-coupled amino acid transporter-like protein pathetic [Acyrthosiphon pisum]XP_016660358.1 proton-coupled amino acid transporter-like protein pathetic [Acyrthosiphon pisum]|eukprot:XP_001951501.1 PREDICTED: proton-coupled amino acid transporter 1-like [Acyrthosiphon pisum]